MPETYCFVAHLSDGRTIAGEWLPENATDEVVGKLLLSMVEKGFSDINTWLRLDDEVVNPNHVVSVAALSRSQYERDMGGDVGS